MPILPDHIEIERILNLVRGFGWRMDKKETTDKEIRITLKLQKSPEESP